MCFQLLSARIITQAHLASLVMVEEMSSVILVLLELLNCYLLSVSLISCYYYVTVNEDYYTCCIIWSTFEYLVMSREL